MWQKHVHVHVVCFIHTLICKNTDLISYKLRMMNELKTKWSRGFPGCVTLHQGMGILSLFACCKENI